MWWDNVCQFKIEFCQTKSSWTIAAYCLSPNAYRVQAYICISHSTHGYYCFRPLILLDFITQIILCRLHTTKLLAVQFPFHRPVTSSFSGPYYLQTSHFHYQQDQRTTTLHGAVNIWSRTRISASCKIAVICRTKPGCGVTEMASPLFHELKRETTAARSYSFDRTTPSWLTAHASECEECAVSPMYQSRVPGAHILTRQGWIYGDQ
jgi:hypothetical protein